MKTFNESFEDQEHKLIVEAKGELSLRKWMLAKAKEDLQQKTVCEDSFNDKD